MRIVRALFLAMLVTGVASPASAQVVQSLGLGVGLFFPRGFDTRVDGDVLVANLTQPDLFSNCSLDPCSLSLDFDGKRSREGDIGKFRAILAFGEWNVAINRNIEFSAGVSFSSKRVHSRYLDLVNDARSGVDIEQDLRLRMIPITGIVRFLPFGDATGVQPYVGGGVAAVNFRYSETGEFVDPSDGAIFDDRFVASGTALGGVILGGIRLPMGGDVYAFTVEGRYQFASGKTGGADKGFLGDKIDLSGGLVNFGLIVRF